MAKKKLTKKQQDRRDTIEAFLGAVMMLVFIVIMVYGCAALEQAQMYG